VTVPASQYDAPARRFARAAFLTLIFATTYLSAGCNEKNAPEATAEAAFDHAITKTAESDGVSIRLTVAPGELPYTQKAMVIVEVEADAGTSVTVDDYARSIERGEHAFELSAKQVNHQESADNPEGRLKWTNRYTLEFVLPGEYELPGASLTYLVSPSSGDLSKNSEAAAKDLADHSLSTEHVTIVAQSAKSAGLTPEQLTQIEVLPPVEMKEKHNVWVWLVALLALLVVSALLFLRYRRRQNRQEAIVVIPAHEWAQTAIGKLVADDLPGRGMIQEFHYRISDILRGYIERRFGLSACEMTTEEFLATAQSDHRFDSKARDALNRFLKACDMVKYARVSATPADAEALLHTTRSFVERTRERYVQLPDEQNTSISGGRAA